MEIFLFLLGVIWLLFPLLLLRFTEKQRYANQLALEQMARLNQFSEAMLDELKRMRRYYEPDKS